jgi:predicted nucleic acid-binding protein
MNKVFLDTNVILDHALGRAFVREADKIFTMSEQGDIHCYISPGTLYTLAYILEKAIRDVETVREKLLLYLTLFIPVSNFPYNFEQALNDTAFDDIEDAFQYYTALQAGCDFFVTANIKDFTKGAMKRLPVFKPDDYLLRFSK